MALWRTDIDLGKLNLDKLEKRLGNIDGPLDESWHDTVAQFGLRALGAGVERRHAVDMPQSVSSRHGRKNWFFGGAYLAMPSVELESEIRFETLRSSGPGGQHVNTTDSAVRAIHLASGISVKVQTERSQHANKRLAVLLIARRLAQRAEQKDQKQRAERRLLHHQLERGNPQRTFKGERFEPLDG